jgi:type VI protein secretion system component VasF
MAQENGHHNLLMGEEVASSTPHASRCPPSRAAPRAAPQRAAEHASVALSQPMPNGPLAAARELLCNLPGVAASPDAPRQWRDNVDRLLNLAQASLGSAGESSPGSAIVRAAHPALCTLHR